MNSAGQNSSYKYADNKELRGVIIQCLLSATSDIEWSYQEVLEVID